MARQNFGQWLAELFKFGFVGGVAYVVDTGLFNLLRFGPGELLLERPLTAKVISVAVATLVAWLGNRYWTFAGKRVTTAGRELAMFVLVNVGGMLVAVVTLWFSHYVLGLRSPLADNIAANVVGVGLGTIFRYSAYRYWVFPHPGAATLYTLSGGAVVVPPSPATPAAAPRPGSEQSEDRSGIS